MLAPVKDPPEEGACPAQDYVLKKEWIDCVVDLDTVPKHVHPETLKVEMVKNVDFEKKWLCSKLHP